MSSDYKTPSDLAAAEAVRRDFRVGNLEHGVRETTSDFPLLDEVMSKEGEERHAAALVELRRLVELVRPLLEPTKMTFRDFLSGQKPFGQAEQPFAQARAALKTTVDIFRNRGVLSDEEISGVLG